MRTTLLLLCLSIGGISASAQTTGNVKTVDSSYVLDATSTQQLLSQLKIDTTRFLSSSADDACHCIDSVAKLGKTKKELADAVHACISSAAVTYQSVIKVYRSMSGTSKEILVTTDPNDPEFRNYYYDVEREVRSSCKALKPILVNNDDITSQSSYSNNKKSREAYSKGTNLMEQEKYGEAIRYLEEAVKIDPEFAFAWDNLGICYRRSNKLEKAVHAYQVSLMVDSMGKTPLMNLPVALGMLNRNDEAIAAYKVMLSRYPDDAEGYYGLGRIYLLGKKDVEPALENFCQAYNIYIKEKSPYRSDAEQMVAAIYKEMKSKGKEARFNEILKKYGITAQ